MKYRHIGTVLIALSLIAVTFVATARATINFPYVTIEKAKDPYATWTIETAGYLPPGVTVVKETVKLTYYDKRDGLPYSIYPGADNVEVTAETVVFWLHMKDAVKALFLADAYNIEGDLTNGDDFFATGPGWGWGGHY